MKIKMIKKLNDWNTVANYSDLVDKEVFSNVTFEEINSKYLDKISRVFYSGYKDTVDYEGESLEQTKEYIKNLFEDKQEPIFKNLSPLLFVEGKLVGVCIIRENSKVQGPLISYVVIDKSFKGRGFGKILMLKCLSMFIENDFSEAILYVTNTNAPAIKLYESLGFECS